MHTRIAGILVAVLGGAVWLYAGTLPELPEGHPGPGLFPRLIAGGLFGAGLLLLLQSFRRTAPLAGGPPGKLPGAAAVLACVLLFPLLQPRLGFVPALSPVIFVAAMALKARPVTAALTAVAGGAAIYWVFTGLLGVPLR